MNKLLSNKSVILKSVIDASVNRIVGFNQGAMETRFVRRREDYVICYVSSHSGCKMGCKQCFLTQQKQTTFDQVTPEMYAEQVRWGVDYYHDTLRTGAPTAQRINVNFMARGEPLANKALVNDFGRIYDYIRREIPKELDMKLNISTIMPKACGKRLKDIFATKPAHLYYSLYSTDETFRRIWMPNAKDLHNSLCELKEYEEHALAARVEFPVTFHWALIKDQNDSLEEAMKIVSKLKDFRFKSKFNLVRYNAHPASLHTEADEDRITEVFDIISKAFDTDRSYIVPRVGKDVHASCGMFVGTDT